MFRPSISWSITMLFSLDHKSLAFGTSNKIIHTKRKTVVEVVVVRAAKSQGLRLKEVGYIFYKTCALMLKRLRIERQSNVCKRDGYI